MGELTRRLGGGEGERRRTAGEGGDSARRAERFSGVGERRRGGGGEGRLLGDGDTRLGVGDRLRGERVWRTGLLVLLRGLRRFSEGDLLRGERDLQIKSILQANNTMCLLCSQKKIMRNRLWTVHYYYYSEEISTLADFSFLFGPTALFTEKNCSPI